VGLRNVVIAVLGAGVLLGLVLAATRCPAPWAILAFYSALGLVAILIERGRYRPNIKGGSFVPTRERYRDPVSGELVRVYVDDATGLREYRPDPQG
jgi:hypothetical protein